MISSKITVRLILFLALFSLFGCGASRESIEAVGDFSFVDFGGEFYELRHGEETIFGIAVSDYDVVDGGAFSGFGFLTKDYYIALKPIGEGDRESHELFHFEHLEAYVHFYKDQGSQVVRLEIMPSTPAAVSERLKLSKNELREFELEGRVVSNNEQFGLKPFERSSLLSLASSVGD